MAVANNEIDSASTAATNMSQGAAAGAPKPAIKLATKLKPVAINFLAFRNSRGGQERLSDAHLHELERREQSGEKTILAKGPPFKDSARMRIQFG